MIATLTGTIRERGERSVVLEVTGVGYEVTVGPALLASLSPGREVRLYTALHQRDEEPVLYGFQTREEREFFLLLQTVSGVGPRAALGILGAGDATSVRRAIAAGDTSLLTRVSGIGKKTADRLVVELKEQLGGDELLAVGADAGAVVDALVRLGYSAREAREALQRVDRSAPAEEQIRSALAALGSRG